MRILLVGATGLIGTALVARLSAAGHAVVIGARDPGAARKHWPWAPVVRVDFTEVMPEETWRDALVAVDAVVNAVGVFQAKDHLEFMAIHATGPSALFAAAHASGARVVQISALGAAPDSPFVYMASKGRAEQALRQLDGQHTILRPSLVFAHDGASTQWFARLAALPVTPLPGGGRQPIQPVHIDDVCEAVVRLLACDRPPPVLDVVGAEPTTLRGYLAQFKQALQLPGVFVSVPISLLRAIAGIASRVNPIASRDALGMLEAGNTGDARALSALLGRAPRSVDTFFDDPASAPLRHKARLAWLVPLLRVAVAVTWIVTGIVSAFVYPVASSLELLGRTGLEDRAAVAALYGAAALDVALGLSLFSKRFRMWSYRVQMVLIAFYTSVISIHLPEYWAHPYGPILKNLPMLAAIAALHELDRPRGPDRR